MKSKRAFLFENSFSYLKRRYKILYITKINHILQYMKGRGSVQLTRNKQRLRNFYWSLIFKKLFDLPLTWVRVPYMTKSMQLWNFFLKPYRVHLGTVPVMNIHRKYIMAVEYIFVEMDIDRGKRRDLQFRPTPHGLYPFRWKGCDSDLSQGTRSPITPIPINPNCHNNLIIPNTITPNTS